ncbi:MAG: substrate-binding domain-containing protein, partial [SAR324 cluster bacterium]|nr:substrate-binding domain-containing protein [SAR324 cluster bacterium]
VMHNDFVILGPAADKAGITGIHDASSALKKIASSGALFVSRGDDSGTHSKEQFLWKQTGLKIKTGTSVLSAKGKSKSIRFTQPEGNWYYSLGQGMGKVLTFADEKQAYTLADRGTYIKYKFGRKQGLGLEVLCEGDQLLYNPYGVIPVNPEKHPHVKFKLANQFAEWIVSSKAQQLIANYRLEGKQLFFPDAIQ